MGPSVISHWTSEAKKYNVPCHRSCADPTAKLIMCKENPAKIPVWEKIRQSIPQLVYFNRAIIGGTVNVHVYNVRLKQ
jgi:hypothetical protein